MPTLTWIVGAALAGTAAGVLATILAGRARRRPRPFNRPVAAASSASCAVLWVLVFVSVSTPLELAAFAILATACVCLTLVDLADHRLPNAIVLPSLAAVSVLLLASAAATPSASAAIGVVLGAAGMFAFYLAIAAISRGGMGMGDVKLAALLGAAMGYLGLTAWIVALAAAFLTGGVASIIALASRRIRLTTRIPFGPFMIAGAFIAIACQTSMSPST